MQRVEIPGGYATLRDSASVGGRKVVERTSIAAVTAMRRVHKLREDQEVDEALDENTPVQRVPYTEAEMYALQRFEFAGFIALVKHWTLDEPVPRTIDEVEDLDPDVYDPIAAVTRKRVWEVLKRPKVDIDTGVDDQGAPIPDSPTGPSTATGAGERASTSQPNQGSGTGYLPTSPASETSEAATPV